MAVIVVGVLICDMLYDMRCTIRVIRRRPAILYAKRNVRFAACDAGPEQTVDVPAFLPDLPIPPATK